MKKVIIRNVYTWRDLEREFPLHAPDLYHIEVGYDGFMHDIRSRITLTPIHRGEEPTGWDTVEKELDKVSRHLTRCWDMLDEDFARVFGRGCK